MATAIFRHHGYSIDYTPPSAQVNAGDVVTIGAFVGVATDDIPAGILGALWIEGVFDFPLLSGDTPKIGDTMYWDVAALAASVQSAYNAHIIGVCVLLAPGGDSTKVRIKLMPALPAAGAYGP